jgi:hypothetical protein
MSGQRGQPEQHAAGGQALDEAAPGDSSPTERIWV